MSIHEKTSRLFLTAEEKIQMLNFSACYHLTPGQMTTVMIKYVLTQVKDEDLSSINVGSGHSGSAEPCSISFLSWLGIHKKATELEQNFSDMLDQLQEAFEKEGGSGDDMNQALIVAQLMILTCPSTLEEWNNNGNDLLTVHEIEDFPRLRSRYMAIANLYKQYQSSAANPQPFEKAMSVVMGWLIAVYTGS